MLRITSNLFENCKYRSADERCKKIWYGILSVQVLVVVIGTILNLMVIGSYFRRKELHKKIPHLLLMNLAVADLFNATVYGVSHVTDLLFRIDLVSDSKWFDIVTTINITSFTLTLYSSFFLYLIMAAERCIALYFPWHHAHAPRRHFWISIVIVWCFSIVMAPLGNLHRIYYIYTGSHSDVINEMHVTVDTISSIVLIILPSIITLLFIVTFFKAVLGLRSPPGQSYSNIVRSSTQIIQIRKHLKVTGVFFVMYIDSAAVFFPMSLYYNGISSYSVLLREIAPTLLISTSIFNSLLILFYKSDFRPCNQRPRRHNFHEHFQMRPVRTVN